METTINKTTDYSQFQLMGGNRNVDFNHVSKLEKEMKYDPEMFKAQPILVNEHGFIIDGQHRYHAARNLGLPVYYVVKEGASIEAARHLNTTQKRWTMMDFARSHAAAGNKHYIDFIRTVEKYPQLTPTIIAFFLRGGTEQHNRTDDFRKGEFRIEDLEEGYEMCDKLVEIQRLCGFKANMAMAVSLVSLLDNEDFDWDTFISKLNKDSARQGFGLHNTRRDSLRAFEDVYNFQSKFRTRLY